MQTSARIFKALGDATRLRIVHLLAQRGPGICVCDLVDVLHVPQSTISRQIAPLRALGLVRARRAGTWMLYALEEQGGAFFRSLRACIDAVSEDSEALRFDLARFDELKRNRELASCCQPTVMAAARADAGESACCDETQACPAP